MNAFVVVDLGFGDAGKGSLVDYLVRRENAHTVVRFNGGAQAAHNVVLPDGRHHTFAQFGSGTFVPGVRTHLSRFMLVDPLALAAEERHLRTLGITDAFERLTIAGDAPLVSPFQKAANRLREIARGKGRHGSCGMGIGETMADMLVHDAHVPRAKDLESPRDLREKLRFLQELKWKEFENVAFAPDPIADRELALLRDPAAADECVRYYTEIAKRLTITPDSFDALHTKGNILFEAAQGVLLDEWYGFHPHTTWSTTTFANATTLLSECGYPGRITRIGALRAWMTRHGAGPFPTEDAELARRLPDAHNGHNAWQRAFRVGWLDFTLLRYALDVAGGADELALTCLDRVEPLDSVQISTEFQNRDAAFYVGDRLRALRSPDLDHQSRLTTFLQQATPRYDVVAPAELTRIVEEELSHPVRIISRGTTHLDKTTLASASLPVHKAGANR